MTTVTDVANLALDATGIDIQVGSMEEGGRTANLLLRAYAKCRQELLRGAPWAFARKQMPLQLLADASGQTPNVLTTVPGTQFLYEYGYPIDCMRMRYIPQNPLLMPGVPTGNITPSNPSPPLTSGNTTPIAMGTPIRPSLFVVTNDPNILADPNSNWAMEQGQSPTGCTVILSNVPSATMVYTFDATAPSLWDPQFRSAIVAYIASEISVAVWTRNPTLGLKMRADQIALAKNKILEARVADGNEMSVSTSHLPDWMRVRHVGGPYSAGYSPFGAGGFEGAGFGTWGGGWGGSCSFSDGSSY